MRGARGRARERTRRLPAGAWVDVDAAFEALARAEAAMVREQWRDAWGPAHVAHSIAERTLLPGFDAAWLTPRRRELEELLADALECMALIGLRLGGSELAAAERAARRLIDLAPLRGSGHVALMEVQAARGNAAQALTTYEDLRTRLREELGTTPAGLTHFPVGAYPGDAPVPLTGVLAIDGPQGGVPSSAYENCAFSGDDQLLRSPTAALTVKTLMGKRKKFTVRGKEREVHDNDGNHRETSLSFKVTFVRIAKGKLPKPESPAGACTDGEDNDADGLLDEADEDCFRSRGKSES